MKKLLRTILGGTIGYIISYPINYLIFVVLNYYQNLGNKLHIVVYNPLLYNPVVYWKVIYGFNYEYSTSIIYLCIAILSIIIGLIVGLKYLYIREKLGKAKRYILIVFCPVFIVFFVSVAYSYYQEYKLQTVQQEITNLTRKVNQCNVSSDCRFVKDALVGLDKNSDADLRNITQLEENLNKLYLTSNLLREAGQNEVIPNDDFYSNVERGVTYPCMPIFPEQAECFQSQCRLVCNYN